MEVEIKGIDVVAAVAVVCLSMLVYAGHNSAIVTLLSTIIGYYFGRRKGQEE